MKFEATASDIRALLQLAAADQDSDQPASEEAARRVPRPLLDRYQLLLEAGRTPVVVAIERGACSGCHVRLPTMVEYQARHSPAVHTCPRCRRMLFAPELVRDSGAEEGKPSGRATGSAARRS